MCLSGTTFLPADYCFSELALSKFNSACWSCAKRTSSSSLSPHQNVTCSRHDIAENFYSFGVKQQFYSLTQIRGRGRIVVGFTTTYAISAYHH